jgi:hypothetical protein
MQMHPPKIMVWGGIVDGGTFEFDAPDSAIDAVSVACPNRMCSIRAELSFVNVSMQQDSPRKAKTGGVSSMLKWNRRKGKEATNMMEEFDESVYFLTLNHDKWEWSKPIVHGNRAVTMHAVCTVRVRAIYSIE